MKIAKWLALPSLALSVMAFSATTSAAEKPTFTKDVLPIMQEHCQICHRAGGQNLGGMVAPMAFENYKEVRPWSKAIAKAVSTKAMPPWDAAPEHAGEFLGERGLSQEEIDTIVSWVEGGATRGNPKDAPEPLEFPSVDGWSIGEPDLVVSMPDPYFVPDDVVDETKYFPMELTKDILPTDRWIKAVEFRPGSEVVHHIIARPFGGIAPGNAPRVYRDGYAAKVKTETRLVWNMHYHKEAGAGTGMWDQSSLGVKFYPEGYTPEHVLTTLPLGPRMIKIPAGESDYKQEAWHTFEKDALITRMMPHMHLRGKKVLYTLHYPDGKEETLLSVPEYDFNWQTLYRFKEPKAVPAGTKVQLEGWWDNSANNPHNPNAEIEVTWGEATDEEMLFGWLVYTNADEDATAFQGIPRRGRSSDDDD
jgi:mono/diheme cytochrome c family protein